LGLGARLDRPENFWGIGGFPKIGECWNAGARGTIVLRKTAGGLVAIDKPQARSASSQAILDKIEDQLSEERLRPMFAKLVKPLQAEVNELREKLSRDARRNRFEVSLGQIPPEVEQKLWERLRQELGTRVLQEAREQSKEVLGAAKNTIEQKITESQAEFRHRLAGELHAVEQRAQALSHELASAKRQQVRAGVEKLKHQALDGGAQLRTSANSSLRWRAGSGRP
jgi:hypothetical protein